MMYFKDALRSAANDPSQKNILALADDLLAEMSLKEKIRLTTGLSSLRFYAPPLVGKLRGSYFYYPFYSGGCKRLGIPPIKFTDGPRGVVVHNSTCFPVASMRAACFDDELESRIAKAIGEEVLAAGANYFAGICVNVVRNPRWGRAQESYGEDPYMSGRKGVIYTKVLQDMGIITCPKHFAMNSVENLRFHINVNTDERTLREVYLVPFQMCINAGTMSIMSAYNKVNGAYCGENRRLLTDILRDEMGFQGFVMSDFIYGIYHCKESYEAGMDMEMPMHIQRKKAEKEIKEGLLDSKYVDICARNILRSMLTILPNRNEKRHYQKKTQEHLSFALEAAENGTVLLKNTGILPLQKNAKIAVVGPFADTVNVGDEGSSFVWCKDGITPYHGIRKLYPDALVYNGTDIQKALQISRDADVAVVVVGSDRFREGEMLNNHVEELEKDPSKKMGGDRDSLSLTQKEIALIKALKQAGKQVVVSLLSGSVILTEEFQDDADAILMSFYGGYHAGTALANILSGAVNPSGKMPFTVAKNAEDYPQFRFIGEKPYEIQYGPYHGYTLFDKQGITPRYPFGFGLSYTDFEIKPMSVEDGAECVVVSACVKNVGSVAGAEVVQVYVGSDDTVQERPVKLLRGYEKVFLRPQEEKTVSIRIDKNSLRFYDPDKKEWQLDGAYSVYIGNSSANTEKLSAAIRGCNNH